MQMVHNAAVWLLKDHQIPGWTLAALWTFVVVDLIDWLVF